MGGICSINPPQKQTGCSQRSSVKRCLQVRLGLQNHGKRVIAVRLCLDLCSESNRSDSEVSVPPGFSWIFGIIETPQDAIRLLQPRNHPKGGTPSPRLRKMPTGGRPSFAMPCSCEPQVEGVPDHMGTALFRCPQEWCDNAGASAGCHSLHP